MTDYPKNTRPLGKAPSNYEVANATITEAAVRLDRGCFLCAWLTLDYGGLCQGFGGHVLGGVGCAAADHKSQPNLAADVLTGYMTVGDVDEFAKLKGRNVRVLRPVALGEAVAVGHITKDVWYFPRERLESLIDRGSGDRHGGRRCPMTTALREACQSAIALIDNGDAHKARAVLDAAVGEVIDKSRHTPGPWAFVPGQSSDHSDGGGGGFCIVMDQQGRLARSRYVEHVVDYAGDLYPEDGDQYYEAEANARLIAAAPDLLAACKLLADDVEGCELDASMVAARNAAVAAIAKAEGGAA